MNRRSPGIATLSPANQVVYNLGLDLLDRVLATHIVGLICQDDDMSVHIVAPGEEPLPLIDALAAIDWQRARRVAEEFSE